MRRTHVSLEIRMSQRIFHCNPFLWIKRLPFTTNINQLSVIPKPCAAHYSPNS